MQETLVSVVIPAVTGPGPLGRCLEKVLRQRYDNKEVLVVCAQKQEPPVPEEAAQVRLIRHGGPAGTAGLINAGLKAARGRLKVVLMPYCVPAGERWLEGLIEPFEADDVAVVVSECSSFEKREMGLAARLMHSVSCPELESRGGKPSELQVVSYLCDAYRASVLDNLGYLNEDAFASSGEAIDLSIRIRRAGWRIVLNPKVTVYYEAPPENHSLRGALRKAFEYGYSDAVLGKTYDLEWLGSRRYAATVAALLLLPFGAVNLPLAVIAAGALFVWGWFLPLRCPLLHWEWPIAAWNLAAYVVVMLLVRDEWMPGLFDRRLSHPAIIRQWCMLGAMTASYLLILLYAGVRGVARSIVRDKSRLSALPLLPLGMLWWLVSGIGFLKGLLLGRAAQSG